MSPPATRATRRARVISSTSAEEARAAVTARAVRTPRGGGSPRGIRAESEKGRATSRSPRVSKVLSRRRARPIRSRGRGRRRGGRRLSFVAPALLRAKPVYARSASMAAGSNTTHPDDALPRLELFRRARGIVGSEGGAGRSRLRSSSAASATRACCALGTPGPPAPTPRRRRRRWLFDDSRAPVSVRHDRHPRSARARRAPRALCRYPA